MEGNKEGANLKLATKCHLLNTCGGEGGVQLLGIIQEQERLR